jgi:tRNA (guanine-N7-)-methyltransferase
VGRLLARIAALELTNLRVMCHDAVEVLRHRIPPSSLDTVQIFFPDPWHKKRHHKRRIIQPEFVALLARAIRPGGTLHLATDWEDYARHMLEILKASPAFRNTVQDFAPRPAQRPLTRFEQRGHGLGHGVWDIVFVRREV